MTPEMEAEVRRLVGYGDVDGARLRHIRALLAALDEERERSERAFAALKAVTLHDIGPGGWDGPRCLKYVRDFLRDEDALLQSSSGATASPDSSTTTGSAGG